MNGQIFVKKPHFRAIFEIRAQNRILESELSKENTDKDETSFFLDLDMKARDGKFKVGSFDKRDSFTFSIVRIPNKSSNVTLNSLFCN